MISHFGGSYENKEIVCVWSFVVVEIKENYERRVREEIKENRECRIREGVKENRECCVTEKIVGGTFRKGKLDNMK